MWQGEAPSCELKATTSSPAVGSKDVEVSWAHGFAKSVEMYYLFGTIPWPSIHWTFEILLYSSQSASCGSTILSVLCMRSGSPHHVKHAASKYTFFVSQNNDSLSVCYSIIVVCRYWGNIGEMTDFWKDYCDGFVYRSHPLFSDCPEALQIMACYDDVEVCNPLGLKANKHKLGRFYQLPVCTYLICSSIATVHSVIGQGTSCSLLTPLQPTQLLNAYGWCVYCILSDPSCNSIESTPTSYKPFQISSLSMKCSKGLIAYSHGCCSQPWLAPLQATQVLPFTFQKVECHSKVYMTL